MVAGRQLAAVTFLNVVQGLPAYFFTLGLPALMREAGASLDVVVLTYIVWLPWALKWLWSPRFDKEVTAPFGSRISWMRTLPVLMAVGFASLLPLTPTSPPLYLLSLALVCAVIGATLQVVLGAFVLQRFGKEERATANALQIAGMTAGSLIGGGVLLYLGEHLGWHGGIAMIVALILLASLPSWLIPGYETRHAHYGAENGTTESLLTRPWLALSPRSGRIVVFMLLAAGAASGDALIAALLIDEGFSSADVGWMLGMLALFIMMPLSWLVGLLLRAFGKSRTIALLLCLKAALSFALANAGSIGHAALAVVSIASFCLGAGTMVAFWQLYMSSVNPSHSATGFAFLTSLEAFFLMVAGIGGGQVAAVTGTGWLYVMCATGALSGAAFVMISKKAQEA